MGLDEQVTSISSVPSEAFHDVNLAESMSGNGEWLRI